jgi:ComF family protein
LNAAPLREAPRRLWTGVLDFVYPRRCFGCGSEGQFICIRCISGLARADPPRCEYCWSPRIAQQCASCPAVRHLDGVRSGFVHQGLAREAVIELKYNGISSAGTELGARLAEALSGWIGGAEVIVPVPLHPARQRTRGYNQAERLAQGVAARIGLPVDSRLLRRSRRTRSQAAGLNYEQRLENVRDAFETHRPAAGMRILLVDDVITTTATMQACAAALKAAGAELVCGVSFTREG